MKSRWIVVFALLGVTAMACKKGGSAPSDGTSEGGASTSTTSAGPKTTAVGSTGLTFQLPAGAEVGEVTELLGSFTYPCCGGAAIQVNPIKADSLTAAKTFDEAKKGTNDYTNAKILASATTADGWRIEYTHDTGMGPTFKVLVRHQFGANAYDCEASADDKTKAELAGKGCESLAPKDGAKVASASPASSATITNAQVAPSSAASAASSGSTCDKAVRCCKALSGDTAPSCNALANAVELTCSNSLTSFRKAVKATKPAKLSQCD